MGIPKRPPIYLDSLMDAINEGYIDEYKPNEEAVDDEAETKVINKKKPMKKVINMATGGLMSLPPYLRNTEKKDSGITPYDVNTPDSARKGLPQRGLSASRTRYSKGKEVIKPAERPGMLPMEPDDFMTEDEMHSAGNKSVKDLVIQKNIDKLQGALDSDVYEGVEKEKIEKKIEELKNQKSENKVKLALGGYMDNFQISQEEPLAKFSIGGSAALSEKYDRRKDYKAYAKGDEVIAEEEIVEEPLMAPVGMEEGPMPLIEDEIAADDLAMEEDVAMEDAESILDTSMLSEEEEAVVDAAIEMYPELEAILPKMVATEFTEDGEVEGPGTGTSDSIPALLSDGEFVFTAKAVKNIGIYKLRKMIAQAEEAYDAGMVEQEDAAAIAEAETIV